MIAQILRGAKMDRIFLFTKIRSCIGPMDLPFRNVWACFGKMGVPAIFAVRFDKKAVFWVGRGEREGFLDEGSAIRPREKEY